MTNPSPSDLVLHPEIEQRLPQGVRLYIEAYSDDDGQSYPTFVGMDLNRETLERVLRRARTCVSEELSMVADSNRWPDDVEEGDDVEVDIHFWSMRVTAGTFWFRGEPKYGGWCETRAVDIRDLLLALQPESNSSEQLPPGFRWYGGALLYSPRPDLKLADYLGACRPELAANQRAIEMGVAIAGQRADESAERPPATTPRRRPGL